MDKVKFCKNKHILEEGCCDNPQEMYISAEKYLKFLIHSLRKETFIYKNSTLKKDEKGFNNPDSKFFKRKDLKINEKTINYLFYRLSKYKKQLEHLKIYNKEVFSNIVKEKMPSELKKEVESVKEVRKEGSDYYFHFRGGKDFGKLLVLFKSNYAIPIKGEKFEWKLPVEKVYSMRNFLKNHGFDLGELKSPERETKVPETLKRNSLEITLERHKRSKDKIKFKTSRKDNIIKNFFMSFGEFEYNKSDYTNSLPITLNNLRLFKKVISLGKKYKWKLNIPEDIINQLKEENSRFKEILKSKEDVSIIEGLNLKIEPYPHQNAGIRFIDKLDGNAIIGDPPGLGKTLQAIAYSHWRNKKTLVICPNSLKYNWQNEVNLLTDRDSIVLDAQMKKEEVPEKLENFFTIVNYESINKYEDIILNSDFDQLVIDESHFIKSNKTKRYKNIEKISKKIKDTLGLTGTAIVNRPIEFYYQSKLIQPKELPNLIIYAKKYCNGFHNGYGWDFSGHSNLDKLNKLIQTFYIRRSKEDVLKDLPSKIRDDIVIKNLKVNLDSDLDKLKMITKMKENLALEKIDHSIEFIKDFIENEEKVVVFSDFVEPVARIESHFKGKVIALKKEHSPKERAEIVKIFEEDPQIKIFVSTIPLGGVGLTLTSSSNVVFNDLPWTPAAIIQAEDRCHRISQKDTVNVYRIISDDPLEKKIMKILDGKTSIFEAALEGKEFNPEDHPESKDSIINEIASLFDDIEANFPVED